MSQNFYNNLTHLYPVSRTITLELKPVGATREHIQAKHLIESDETIAECYKRVKELIDKVHKKIIDETLVQPCILPESSLNDYYETYLSGDSAALKDIEAVLRSSIADKLKKHPSFENLFGAKMVREELPKIATTQEELDIIDVFNRFTTYLTNYHEVRKNLYSDEEKHSTVPYRAINENLPKHIQNVIIYEDICEKDYDIYFYAAIESLEQYLGDIRLDEVFSVSGFNNLLAQRGIDTYNQIIGGISTETTKLKGLNEVINLWNQAHPSEKLPKFSPLYKQMLSDAETKSFVIDKFESDEQVYSALIDSFIELSHIAYTAASDKLDEFKYIHESTPTITYESFYCDIKEYDKNGIFITTDNLADLSVLLFGKWNVLRNLISLNYDKNYTGKKKTGTGAYDKEKEAELKKKKSYTIAELEAIIVNNSDEITHADILAVLRSNAMDKLNDLRIAQRELNHALGYPKLAEKKLKKNEELISAIKTYLDSIKTLQNNLRLLQYNIGAQNKDERFYGDLNALWDSFIPFNTLYNKVRNYITSKPFSNEKLKLNFGSPTFLGGWDSDNINTNLGLLFQKDGTYYLGIMDKDSKKAFKEMPEGTGETYDNYIYKQFPKPELNLPRVFLKPAFSPSEEVLRIAKEKTHTVGKNFSLDDCHTLIDFFKEGIRRHEDYSKFDFNFSDTKTYKNIADFYREVSDQGYMFKKRSVSAEYIDNLVETGQLYLFQIYRNDFSPCATGNLDLQTIYFKMLFDERNLSGDITYKLTGGAEVFYRMPSLKLEDTAIHKKGSVLTSKNPLNPVKEKIAKWDIIKDKRYTQEKFTLHLGISLNHVSKNLKNINNTINNEIRKMDEFHIIGINRGERNLIYATVINQNGEIVDSQQISLNVITQTFNNGKNRQETDYLDLLTRKAKERDDERKSWAPIEQIKNIKSGYLSQAIHVITQLAVKYNAFIAIENLDSDFMHSRQKIEKQIYQNFEKALITKLNYLVTNKSRELKNVDNAGGALAAYQLTNQFESFKKLGIQSGILFRVPTYYISNIDPTTGFVNFIYPTYETMEKSKNFFSTFERIRYNAKEDYFEFDVDLSKFTSKAEGTKKEWTVCTYGKRLRNFRNEEKQSRWETEVYYPTEKMKDLLDEYNIYYEDGKCLIEAITEQTKAAFYKELTEIVKMTLQMRNTGFSDNAEDDFLQSCVKNEKNEFFNSFIASEMLPRSTDANGAYNVARKALMMIERIRESKDGEKIKLAVSNAEWLQYAQKEA